MEYVLNWSTVTDVIITDESLSGESCATGTFGINPLDSDSISDQDKVKTPPGAGMSSRPSSRHTSRPTTPIDLIRPKQRPRASSRPTTPSYSRRMPEPGPRQANNTLTQTDVF